MNNNTHPCSGKCRRFKEGRQCPYCLINETRIQGVYLIYRTEHRIDHIVEPNEMGDDAHIENNISTKCKTESQPVFILESDNQIIERLKAENVVLQAKVDELQVENKILNQAASTHLKNQMHFKKLYDALVEQLYPYALDLKEQPNFSFKNCSSGCQLGVIAGYKTASENASFEILEMLKGDEEYIKSQCGMLGGGEA